MGHTNRDSQKYFFTLPNAVFDLKLHVYELAIYAYLLRIEDMTRSERNWRLWPPSERMPDRR